MISGFVFLRFSRNMLLYFGLFTIFGLSIVNGYEDKYGPQGSVTQNCILHPVSGEPSILPSIKGFGPYTTTITYLDVKHNVDYDNGVVKLLFGGVGNYYVIFAFSSTNQMNFNFIVTICR
uniref:Uncharacterized protein n=1 Tax=Graphocephala atropunctata TaxID=36148 RepID=A0A1B6MN78_9HEMI